MKSLLVSLKSDYPHLTFAPGKTFYWSPKDATVYYHQNPDQPDLGEWSLLHEVSHGILGHTTYRSDFELMELEVEAWHYADALAKKYGITIDSEHVQDCLDTYRDWLHRRSTCPKCGMVSPQKQDSSYTCLNCRAVWRVSNSRFCRPYRKVTRA